MKTFFLATCLASTLLLTSCSTLMSGLLDDSLWWDEPKKNEKTKDTAPRSSQETIDFDSALLGASFLGRSVQAYQRANTDLTPQQEYYLGRSFGATVLQSRKPLENVAANRYVNQIGQALARTSDRAETWAGYRFLILDTPQVNAFAAPGGFIFVTKGLVRLTRNEAELAAVLAHEIAHVEQEHGLKAVRKDRLTTAVLGIGADAARTYGSAEVRELTLAFEDSVTDLTKTIVNNGYSRDTEYEADDAALRILRRAGYPASALLTMLSALTNLPASGVGGFSQTHPAPSDRMAEVKKLLGSSITVNVSSPQKRRFQAALDGL